MWLAEELLACVGKGSVSIKLTSKQPTKANPDPKLTYKGYMRQETRRVRYITSNIAVEAVSVLGTELPTQSELACNYSLYFF